MTQNPMTLGGRYVMITGASSGIGRETAILLSTLEARVVLVGRRQEQLQETLSQLHGTGHLVQPFDLSATDKIVGWMKEVAAQTGPLSGVVHAAGKQLTVPVRVLSPTALDDLLRTNLQSALMLTRGFCQRGCKAPEGSIVFVSSVMGMVGKPALAAYSASKAALVGMVRSLALELATERVRVNCVAPGFVQTEMLQTVRETLSAEDYGALERSHPLGFGTPRDVAWAVAFLLAETSRWITGTTLVVDGGYTAQ